MAAQINIKVNSDFAKASADLKKFGTVTEQEAKRVQRFQESFKTEQIDSFIDKTRRTGAAMKGMGGEMASLTAQQKALQRQAESLVKKGLDPQDASVQKLVTEYDRLEKEIQDNVRAQKAMENASKVATTSLLAIGAAVVGVGIAAIKSSVELAKMGDTLAKTAARTGIGVEALQEYSFAAERSGLSANALGGIFQKLNKSIGDVQANTGALTTFLKESNPALLEQLSTITDTDEAFNLLLSEIEKAPTQFEKAALAQAAFGRSGQDLINFADLGATEIARLREEAQAYGVISVESAEMSEKFVDSQRNLTQAFIGQRAEMATKLLPAMTDVMNGFARFIADTDKVQFVLNTLVAVLTGVTVALTIFLVVTKGAAAINVLTGAFAALNVVLSANPIGLIALAIGVVITATIFLAKNWDAVVVLIQTTTEILKEKLETFIVATKSKWISQLNLIKITFLELAQIIIDKLLGAVQGFLDLAGKLPFVGEKFQELSDSVGTVRDSLNDNIDAAQAASDAAIAGADAAILAREAERDANIALAREERVARLAELRAASKGAAELSEEQTALLEQNEENITNILVTSLQERLSILNDVEAMSRAENIETFQTFLNARAEQEGVAGEARIAFLQSELERIQSLEDISNAERVAAAATVQDMITAEEKRASDERIDLRRREAAATATLLGSLSALVTAFAGENRAAAIAAKGLAMAQAGINSALAFTQVIADPTLPFFLKGISAASILASGLAQQINIGSTSIPSAQTGTGASGFTVPTSNSAMADTSQVNVSEGEQIVPRGESRDLTVNVQVADEVIWSSVQRGIDANEITVTDDNIRAVG